MKLNLKLAQRLFLCATPLVTGSLFFALPSLAATLSSSQASISFSNFNLNPLSANNIETFKNPNTPVLTNNGQVTTEARADANFSLNSSNPSGTSAFANSYSRVEGNGNGYSNSVESSARAQAYSFEVGAGQTFSFNFNGLLNLTNSIDSTDETANAAGTVVFQLYETNDSGQPPTLLDSFIVDGRLSSLDNSDYLDFNVLPSLNVSLNPNTTNTSSFGGNKESANSSFSGQFSRLFNRATSLLLRGFTTNSAGASCPAR